MFLSVVACVRVFLCVSAFVCVSLCFFVHLIGCLCVRVSLSE